MYEELVNYIEQIQRQIEATAAALYVMRRGDVVLEWYNGCSAEKRFNVYSCRKSYIALAFAIAQEEGAIGDLNKLAQNYLPYSILGNTTLRHLVTYTHGLRRTTNGVLFREFEPGTHWAYSNQGIELMTEIFQKATGQTVSHFLQNRVFDPHGFQETGWETEWLPELVQDVHADGALRIQLEDNASGNGYSRNLFVSPREFAKWGELHRIGTGAFRRTTTLQSPPGLKQELPRNGYNWQVQADPAACSELGELVPRESYGILGINGCHLLVVPNLDLVAVRMYNKIGNPPGYDYLQDIRTYTNLVVSVLSNNFSFETRSSFTECY